MPDLTDITRQERSTLHSALARQYRVRWNDYRRSKDDAGRRATYSQLLAVRRILAKYRLGSSELPELPPAPPGYVPEDQLPEETRRG